MDALQAEAERLRIAIDAVVPADDFPSASHAGGLRFWSRVAGTERPEWADRVIAVLDLLDRHAVWAIRRHGCRRTPSRHRESARQPRLRLVRPAGQRGVLRRPR
jgi:hypothetical protein